MDFFGLHRAVQFLDVQNASSDFKMVSIPNLSILGDQMSLLRLFDQRLLHQRMIELQEPYSLRQDLNEWFLSALSEALSLPPALAQALSRALAHPWTVAEALSVLLVLSAISGLFWLLFWTAAWPRMWAFFWHRWRIFRLSTIPSVSERAAAAAIIPDSKFLEIDNLRLHYVQGGEGPDVILLHGIGASIYIWRFLFSLLQVHFRVTAFDIPGFGKSSKDSKHNYGLDSQSTALLKAIDQLGITNPVIVGSSMGGAIALWMAKLQSERFKKVFALAPAVDHALLPPRVKLLATGAPLLRRALNRHTMKLMLTQVLSRRDLVTDATVDAYLEPFLDSGDSVRAFWNATSLLSDPRLPGDLKSVNCEVVVIYGERDGMVPYSTMVRLMRILPNAKLLTHAHAGHHLMEDEPEWLADVLLKELNVNTN